MLAEHRQNLKALVGRDGHQWIKGVNRRKLDRGMGSFSMSLPRLRDALVRRRERRVLIRELLDNVAHQVSTISLQAMSRLDGTDVDDLRSAMRTVSRSAATALTELRMMTRVFCVNPGTPSHPDSWGALNRQMEPTAVAADWARRLRVGGFDPVVEIADEVDQLSATVKATIARALDVACHNLSRHAPQGARCRINVECEAADVIVTVSNPLPSAGGQGERYGTSLRGLRGRINLLGGSLRAGPSILETDWAMIAVLPWR